MRVFFLFYIFLYCVIFFLVTMGEKGGGSYVHFEHKGVGTALGEVRGEECEGL